jgi:hypothetical protein
MILYAIGNNTIRLNSAFLGITQAPVPPSPSYNGFTYSTNGSSTFTFDPANGVAKNIAVHYEQLDGDWSLDCTGNADPNGSPGDCPNLYAPSAGTYVMSFDSSDYENATGGTYDNNAGSITSIDVYDFMHKNNAFLQSSDQSVFGSCSRIPTATSGWINAESLTSVSNAFAGCPITGALEPSITSLSAAAPKLSNVGNCFGGCTGASDYAHCLTAYSDWFNGSTPTPTPTADYDYKVELRSSTANGNTLNVNTFCLNRNNEGNGNCYSDNSCTNELYSLEAWDSSTSDTTLEADHTEDSDYVYYFYVKNASIDAGCRGTLIAGSVYNMAVNTIRVYDSSDNMVAEVTGLTPSSGEWIEYNYSGSSRIQCPECGGTGQTEVQGPCNCIYCSTCQSYGSHSDNSYYDETTGEGIEGSPCPHYSDDNPDGTINPDPNCSECGGTGAITGYSTCWRCGGTGWIEE